jgi:putative Mg2+ transporter-C (MgtC) family protein
MESLPSYASQMTPHAELILRLAAAAGLGGIIGLEREMHGRSAGFRTHLVVALASSLFMVVSANFPFVQPAYPSEIPIHADISRIASTVVSGIGFLGAGAILRTGFSIQGLTTAAVLWLDAAIGLAIGSGLYIEGVTATAFTLIALVVLWRLERKGRTAERLTVSFTVASGREIEARKVLASDGRSVAPVEISDAEGGRLMLNLEVSGDESLTVDDVRRVLKGFEGLSDLRVSRFTG